MGFSKTMRFASHLHASRLGSGAGSMMNFQPRDGKAKPTQVKQLLDAIEGLDHG